MSELLKKIAADQLQARKDRNPVATSLLTTLLGEAGKLTAEDHKKGVTEVTDARVIATVKSFIANVEIAKTATLNEFERVAGFPFGDQKVHETDESHELALKPMSEKIAVQQAELALLEVYVPTQLDEAQLREKIGAWKTEGLALGDIMAKLKTDFGGQYDGKMASTIARE